MSDATIVDTDRLCPACGYNLRGLSAQGQCPECGGPVWYALCDHPAQFADPRWLRSLAWGTRCLWAGFLVLLVAILALAFSAAYMYRPSGGAVRSVLLLAEALLALGLWLITASNSAQVAEPTLSARRVARSALVACTALTLLLILMPASRPLSYWTPRHFFSHAVIPLLLASGALAIVLVWSFSRHTERLSRDLGHRFAQRKARFYRRAFITFVAATVALLLLPDAGPLQFLLRLSRILAGVSVVFALIYAALVVLQPVYLRTELCRCLARDRRAGFPLARE
jgi:hypothetical protein